MYTNFDSAKKYINLKRTHGHESLCGPGSHKCNTRDTVKFINDSIKKYNIKSILDLGCGDWNWFNEIKLDDCTYIGWDCDDEMISNNTQLYGTDLIMFETKDMA